MIPYAAYKIVHYAGIFLLVTVLGAALSRAALAARVPAAGGGGDAPGGGAFTDPWRRALVTGHGVALFLVLLGGFGMLARLGVGFPGWVLAKLGLWLILGAALAARRSPRRAAQVLVAVPLLALLAGALAFTKPF
ncbi:MAG: hypothetical protein RQ751_09605 [Longimicrobiales bacterium]|nr:hypothetical protein [Longimicrobiales bacterium]